MTTKNQDKKVDVVSVEVLFKDLKNSADFKTDVIRIV